AEGWAGRGAVVPHDGGLRAELLDQAVVGVHATRTLSAVLARPIRIAPIVACLFVRAGWGLFAIDQVRGASAASVAGIAGALTTFPDPPPDQEEVREKLHSKPRECIDDVHDI